MSRAAIYGRVSTTSRELDWQVRELEQEVARRGLPLVERYLEKVSAAGGAQREEYYRLFRDAADPARAYEHLFVWSLDRFSRAERFTQGVEAIWELEKRGSTSTRSESHCSIRPKTASPVSVGKSCSRCFRPSRLGSHADARSGPGSPCAN